MKYLNALLKGEEIPRAPREEEPLKPVSAVSAGASPRGTGSPETIYQELADATPPPAALEVFQDWAGLLIKSAVLEMSVWVVRSRQFGKELAQETGHPALLLDDVLSQRGATREETRAALLPVLITGVVQ